MNKVRWRSVSSVFALALMSTATPSLAEPEQKLNWNLEQQNLDAALRAIGRTTSHDIIFPAEAVKGHRAPALNGTYTALEAVKIVLKGTSWTAVERDGAILIRERSSKVAGEVNHDAANTEIVVTGSLIAGVASPSPMQVINRERMLDNGYNSLGEAIRALPVASGAGQNPGIGQNVPESVGSNLGGGTSINLRGLGSDATITLLNGHRLAFNTAVQSIDISAIPLAAVERMEIVTDGASAIYGSDAIAGVANIILRKDYRGLTTRAYWGASTDGGNVQQNYSVTGGTTWKTGGFILAYDFGHSTPILSSQRGYAAARSPGLTLYPGFDRHNMLFSGHQDLVPGVTFSIDGLYGERTTDRAFASSVAGDYRIQGLRRVTETRTLSVAPNISLDVSNSWKVNFSGVYATDRTLAKSDDYWNSVLTRTELCYCNKAFSVEGIAQGTLFDLGAGAIKAALGGGYRKNFLHSYNRLVENGQSIRASQDNRYGFLEINAPIVRSDVSGAFLQSLILNGAVRYEDYPGIGDVATPKLGAVLSTGYGMMFKVSWGKSFKAPTLYQLHSVRGASVYNIGVFGGTGFPAGTVGLYSGGGNPDSKPERSTNWTASAILQPAISPHSKIEITYYSIRYRNRIVTPVTYITQALSNPIYADLVSLNPTGDEINAALDGALFFNNSSSSWNPAKVGAIIYSQYANAARQKIDGVDISLSHHADIGQMGDISFWANASYIESQQRLSALQPDTELAGTLFFPPHLRGSAGFTWDHGPFRLTPILNYIGGVEDRRATVTYDVASMTTFDLTARLKIDSSMPVFRGMDLSLSAQNIFNNKPSVIATTQVSQAPYDSANYSPWGRYISFSISKSW